MKKLTIILIIAFIASQGRSQNLIDIYKKGTVKLVPDTEYGKGNEWDKVFTSYFDTLYSKPMGNRKSITITPDGSIAIDHAYHNYFSKFDPNGKFIKEFYITSETGYQYKKTSGIAGVVNDNTFFGGLDNLGRMLCFDFDGNYKKTLKLDYMVKQIVSLPNSKIAVVGWVIWKDKFRDFVSIVDYETNEEKIIWDHFTERCGDIGDHCELFKYSYKFKAGGAVSLSTMPFANRLGMQSPPKIESIGNHLIIAYPETGEIVVCDLNGKVLSKKQLNSTTNMLTIAEQKEIQQTAIDKYKNFDKPFFKTSKMSPEEGQKAMQTLIGQMEDDLAKIKDPIPLPYFSNIIKDSDGNLLIYEFPKEENANKFNVWVMKNGGEFVCQSTFVCDDYELEINPSKFVFHDGYVYGLQKLKNAEGMPLRLQRFKLE
ncbi:MAG: hypothetical protein ACERKD_04320 [Prolixibacteraceae bacterium]